MVNAMKHVVIGLGNPGEAYAHTRHNAGARMVQAFHDAEDFSSWKKVGNGTALMSAGEVGTKKVTLVLPQTFMNASGKAAESFIKSTKAASGLIVVYDDLDLPLGMLKISFGRSSGGHKGVESVIKNLKTKDFIRLRVGISPVDTKGNVRKPRGEKQVLDFLLKTIPTSEKVAYKSVEKRACVALRRIIEYGWIKAASLGTL